MNPEFFLSPTCPSLRASSFPLLQLYLHTALAHAPTSVPFLHAPSFCKRLPGESSVIPWHSYHMRSFWRLPGQNWFLQVPVASHGPQFDNDAFLPVEELVLGLPFSHSLMVGGLAFFTLWVLSRLILVPLHSGTQHISDELNWIQYKLCEILWSGKTGYTSFGLFSPWKMCVHFIFLMARDCAALLVKFI